MQWRNIVPRRALTETSLTVEISISIFAKMQCMMTWRMGNVGVCRRLFIEPPLHGCKRAGLQSSELCLKRKPLPYGPRSGLKTTTNSIACTFCSVKLYANYHVDVLSTSRLRQARAGNPSAIGSAGWFCSGPQTWLTVELSSAPTMGR